MKTLAALCCLILLVGGWLIHRAWPREMPYKAPTPTYTPEMLTLVPSDLIVQSCWAKTTSRTTIQCTLPQPVQDRNFIIIQEGFFEGGEMDDVQIQVYEYKSGQSASK